MHMTRRQMRAAIAQRPILDFTTPAIRPSRKRRLRLPHFNVPSLRWAADLPWTPAHRAATRRLPGVGPV